MRTKYGVRTIVQSIFFTILLLVGTIASADDEAVTSSLIERTERFEFHSNFWLNLHHFLHQKAQLPDGRPIEGGRNLSPEEFRQIDGAIDWYRDHLAELSLLRNSRMYALKRAMITFDSGALPEHEVIPDDHRQQLLAAAEIYRKHYWPRHDLQNREIVSWHLKQIRAMEQPVLTRISALAQQPWPDEMIRIDLSWDANWAGAYCTTRPIHAVITSRPGGPRNTWPPGAWLELLFHEPSHAVIKPSSTTVGLKINAIAEQLEMEPPRQLWHAILFLFSGIAVQEAFQSERIDYQLMMLSEGIFSRYHSFILEHLDEYIAGEAELDESLLNLLKSIQRFARTESATSG